jgi:hypothetical protein
VRKQFRSPGDILQEYADRGVFRGFSRGPVHGGTSEFTLVWHRGRTFEVTVDTRAGAVRCPVVLAMVDSASEMYRNLKAFIKSRQAADLPEHRRIDLAKARIACVNRQGNVSVALRFQGDPEYAVRKFVDLVQEIFLVFLPDYFDYQVEAFDLDPDSPV